MDPLSRKLNAPYPKVSIKTDDDQYVSNHLLFIDDQKFFAENEEVFKIMSDEADKFFGVPWLERNQVNSAANCKACDRTAVLPGVNEGYKYLGITENRKSEVSRETYNKIRIEILKGVESICKAGLSGKNTITAIKEYALSVINYYIEAVKLEYADYLRIDDDVRKLLVRHKVHL